MTVKFYDDDDDIFFDTDDFAEVATLADGSTINVIPSREYVETLGVENCDLTIVVKEADAENLSHGDEIIIDGITYTIRAKQQQDDGSVVVGLTR